MVRILGAHLDTSLNFKYHCEKQAKKAMLNYLNIRNIRKLLDKSSCETLVTSLVIFHLDYCNAILYGIPEIRLVSYREYRICQQNWSSDA